MGFPQEEEGFSPEPVGEVLPFPKPKLWWAYKVEQLGAPPTLPQFLLDEMGRSHLTPYEWWKIVGGEQGHHTYGEIDYALRWLRL